MKITDLFIELIFLILMIPILATLVPTGSLHVMTVTGNSMEPTITESDIIVVAPTKDNPSVGDIISYQYQLENDTRPVIITHRVIRVEHGGYRTKGDAYTEPDNYIIVPEDMIGTMYFKIPYLGALVHFAGTIRGLLILVILPAAILIMQEIWEITKLRKK